MKYKLARFLEFLSWVVEDLAERVDRQGAIDEAKAQDKISRRPLVDRL